MHHYYANILDSFSRMVEKKIKEFVGVRIRFCR